MKIKNKQVITFLIIIVLIIAVPMTLYLVRQQQILKSKADFVSNIEFLDAGGNAITVTSSANVKLRIKHQPSGIISI